MAGQLTTSLVVPPGVQNYLDRKTLLRAVPNLCYSQVAYRRPLSKRNGTTMVFRRFNPLALAMAPLVEGVPPQGSLLSKSDISVTLQQWGDFVSLTDYGQMVVENDLLNEASDVLGEQSGQTMDGLLRDVSASGTNVAYGGTATQRNQITTTTHKIDKNLIDRAVRTLDANNAKRFKEMIKPSTKISTQPIRPAYIGICHGDLRFTIQSLQGFISIEQYATDDERLISEFGAINDVRMCYSSQAKVYRGGGGTAAGDVKSTGGLADVGTLLIFGEQAVAQVPMQGGNLKNIVKSAGSAGSADPLDQISTSGWIHTGARLVTNDQFMIRLEVALGNVAP